ncbi:hypothetical protein NYE40_08295 [Paenibacillus sp. FSL W8-1187]|uniref:hypothetical protein n=1 Tax=Paenibacillus sp. FSL W8-1187 TaxID=2975339 RepID=UPI0030DA8918
MKKITATINIIWWISVAINSCAIIWFVLGNTANFQRNLDLVTTVILAICGIPSVILIILSLFMLKHGGVKSPVSMLGVISMMAIMIFLSKPLYENVNTSGWLTDEINADTKQITADNQYEYDVELVNIFQRNSSVRLRLKSLHSHEEQRIKLELPRVNGLIMNSKENFFTTLQPTDDPNLYILKTLPLSPFPEVKFKVDVKNGKANKLN